MATVVDCQPFTDDEPKPQEGRQLGVSKIVLEPGRHVQESVLQNVGGVNPALESRIHAHLDHPAEAVAVLLIQVDQRLAVTAAKPLQ
jgi:hypothetical protein